MAHDPETTHPASASQESNSEWMAMPPYSDPREQSPAESIRDTAAPVEDNSSQPTQAERLSPEAQKKLAELHAHNLGVHALIGEGASPAAKELTTYLATAGDKEKRIHTDAETANPGKLRGEYLPRRRTEGELDTIKQNAKDSLANVEEFRQAIEEDRLGTQLLEVLGSVKKLAFEDTHIADPIRMKSVKVSRKPGESDRKGAMIDGVATIGRTTFTVNSRQEAESLHDALSALSRTARIKDAHHLTHPKEKDGEWTIMLPNLDEYDARMMETAVARIVAEEDAKKGRIGTTLPGPKLTPGIAAEQGITYHPEIAERHVASQRQYEALRDALESPTYRDGMPPHQDTLAAIQAKGEVQVTSPMAVFEVIRKHMNATMKHVRGDGSRNQDQNPNKNERLLIEEGARVKRAVGKPGQLVPPEMRALNLRQSLYERGQSTVESGLEHKALAIGKVATQAMGIGIDKLLELGLAVASPLAKNAKQRRRYKQDWRNEKARAAQSIEKFGKRASEVLQEHADGK